MHNDVLEPLKQDGKEEIEERDEKEKQDYDDDIVK